LVPGKLFYFYDITGIDDSFFDFFIILPGEKLVIDEIAGKTLR
jgi:hypothetical protein